MAERDGEMVARQLRHAILRLQLRPGALLDEVELAERLRVSRTPVREAIVQLIADGLVVRNGRKASVAPLDFDAIPKLYDALHISSRLVHRLAAENRAESDLRQIRQHMETFESCLVSGSGVQRSEANAAFHIAISRASKNRHIARFYERALIDTLRLARACFVDGQEYKASNRAQELREHLETTAREHREIFAAIEAQDTEAADRTAEAHYQLTVNRLSRVLFQPSLGLVEMTDLSLDVWPAR